MGKGGVGPLDSSEQEAKTALRIKQKKTNKKSKARMDGLK